MTRKGFFQLGFTMIELLITVSILGLSMTVVYVSATKYYQQSRDSVRKTHLEKYRVILEEYYADFQRYPPEDVFEDCDGPSLRPYMPNIYCDPSTGEPYDYTTDEQGKNYQLFTELIVGDDPIIAERGCQQGCGPDRNNDGKGDYNYGISSEQAAVGTGGDNTQVAPTCGTGANKFCHPGLCSNCCPGESYRCNSTGTGCYADTRCPGN